MKNIKYFVLFIFCVVFFAHISFSQNFFKPFEIVFKTKNVKDTYLYLTGIYGNKLWIVDSAKNLKNQYVFKNSKQELPSGFYTIQTQTGNILIEFIVDKIRAFSIEETEGGYIFTNSEENIVFQNFKNDILAGNDLRIYYETVPESLLGKFVLAQYIPVPVPEFFWGSHEGREAASKMYFQFIKDHYFDNMDFKDIRLMHTPLELNLADFFTEQLYPQTPENVISSIENVFHSILDKDPTLSQLETQDFYLKKLIHLYMNFNPIFDTVFVYLVDNYVAKTITNIISDSEREVFKRIADRKRRTFVGQTIPVFESYTNERFKISTAEMPSKYTILWFWDPDCEHCIEETPTLCDFYAKYQNLYDFSVIACSVTEDHKRWIRFIEEHHIEWFNTSYSIAAPNYDAVEYFNFDQTPAVFIIDKQQKIVARQFNVEDLFEVFESLYNE